MKRPYGFDPLDTANGNEDTEANEENAIMEADHEEDNDDSNTLRNVKLNINISVK